MFKIAFIGPTQMVSPLWTSGVDVYGCDSPLEADNALSKIYSSKEYGLIFITEKLGLEIKEKISGIENKINVVLLPDHNGSIGFFKERLQNLIKQATGAMQS